MVPDAFVEKREATNHQTKAGRGAEVDARLGVTHAIAMQHKNETNSSMDVWLQTRETDKRNNDHAIEIKSRTYTHLSKRALSQHSRVEPAVNTRTAQPFRSFHRSRGTSQSIEEAPATYDPDGKAESNFFCIASAPTNR